MEAEQLKICVWATGGRYGSGVYEIHRGNMYAGLIWVSAMKEKGLVRRIDHTKKATEFLNTDEGREWFKRNKFH